MCGITGIIGLNKDYQVDKNLLNAMTKVIAHRGPDAMGTHVQEFVGLGHTRLSILDLSAAGKQPMSNEDGSVWICFNGEVYNYKKFVPELKSAGHIFQSNSDTEMILHAYEEWGIEKCIELLNGMFAFCLVDFNKDVTYIVRDRFGIKPLFYSTFEGALRFGSEIKTILQDVSFERKINKQKLSNYLSQFYTSGVDTVIEGVQLLEEGTFLKIENGSVSQHKYWDITLHQEKEDKGLEYYLEELDALVNDSVSLSLVSDVEVGHLLSSGVDSNVILDYMDKHSSNINTFTVDSAIESYSEGSVAKTMAQMYGTNHHSYILGAKETIEEFDKFVYHLDYLNANTAVIGLHFAFKLQKQHAIKVSLIGSAPDELFGGYETYLADRYAQTVRQFMPPAIAKGLRNLIGLKKASFEFVSWDYKAKKFLEGVSYSKEKSHYWWRTIFRDEEKEALFQSIEGFDLDGFQEYNRFYQRVEKSGASFLDQSLYADAKMFMSSNALMIADSTSMSNSVEVRPSFLNHELVDFAFKLPDHYKVGKDKTLKMIMRQLAEQRLPKEFVNLPKKGMNIPISFWINNEMKSFTRDILSASKTEEIGLFNHKAIEQLLEDHFNQRENNMYKIWSLLIFYRWYDLIFKA